MSDPNLDDLLDRAKFGNVSREDVLWTAHALANPTGQHDLYRLIHILGRVGNASEHERLIAPFLRSPEDPMLARMAVIALDEWGLFEKYHDVFLSLLRGVDWDYESDVRIIALTRAGKYLADNKSCSLLASLIDTVESTEADEVVRQAALEGLALATGEAIEKLPPVIQRFDLSSPWSMSVLSRARRRASREC